MVKADISANTILLASLSADPTSPVEGQMYYNTTDKKTKIYNGTIFENLGDKLEGTNLVTGTGACGTVGGTYILGRTITFSGYLSTVSVVCGTDATADYINAYVNVDGVTATPEANIKINGNTSGVASRTLYFDRVRVETSVEIWVVARTGYGSIVNGSWAYWED